MGGWQRQLRPAGWKCYTLYGPPTEGVADGRMVPRRRRDRVPVPRTRARARAAGGRDAQGTGRPDPAASRGRGVAARHRPGRGRVPRHQVRRVPLGLRARSRRRGGRVRRRATTTRCRPLDREPEPTPASARARTSTPSSAARGFSCCAGRSKLRTCSASCCVAVGPDRIVWGTDSTGTAHRSRSSTRSARSGSPSACRSEFGYPALTAADKERILSPNAQELYGVPEATLHAADRERDRSWVTERVGRAYRCDRVSLGDAVSVCSTSVGSTSAGSGTAGSRNAA